MTEELQTVEIRDDFYRDSFGKVIFIIASILVAICAMVALSIYIYVQKPPPVTFMVDKEWRVQPVVPLDQPYLSTPTLLQWTANALTTVFVFDFVHFNEQLKSYTSFFTAEGWQVFLNQLNIYANYNNVQNNKLFINGTPAGAPSIINQGLLSGRYGWWVEMPLTLSYAGNRTSSQTLTLQVLIVRVSTLNNLNGVGIDNVIVTKSTGTNLS